MIFFKKNCNIVVPNSVLIVLHFNKSLQKSPTIQFEVIATSTYERSLISPLAVIKTKITKAKFSGEQQVVFALC